MTLYPASNVSSDSIVYIDYTNATNIVMNSLSGTSVIPYFNASSALTTIPLSLSDDSYLTGNGAF